MAIGPDGFLDGRIETLYVSDEYKVFLLTGQSNGSWRNAYVGVRPFNSLNEAQLESAKANAQQIDKGARLTLSSDQSSLKVYDGFTGTTSSFPLSDLDADVKARLQYKSPAKSGLGNAWDKYTSGNDAAPATPATAQGKPRTFKL